MNREEQFWSDLRLAREDRPPRLDVTLAVMAEVSRQPVLQGPVVEPWLAWSAALTLSACLVLTSFIVWENATNHEQLETGLIAWATPARLVTP